MLLSSCGVPAVIAFSGGTWSQGSHGKSHESFSLIEAPGVMVLIGGAMSHLPKLRYLAS